MTTVTGLTADRMLTIEAASVVDGDVVGDDLVLTKHDGSTINAGNVRGPVGPAGPMGAPPRVTVLTPGVGGIPNPVTDNFEVAFVADAANGIIWHLRYNAGSASAYKWEYMGGSSLYSQIDANDTTAAVDNSFADAPTNPGPSITPPLSGDYEAEYGVESWVSTNGAFQNTAPAYNGAAATNTDRMSHTEPNSSNTSVSANSRKRPFTLNAGQAFKLQYTKSGGNVRMRWISLRPRRVG